MVPTTASVILFAMIGLLMHGSIAQEDPFAGFGFDWGDDDDDWGTGPTGEGSYETAAWTPPQDCYDEDSNCDSFVGQGYCRPSSRYYSYMQNNCRKACGFCQPRGGGGGRTPETGGPNCGYVSCPTTRCRSDEVYSQNMDECCPKCVKRPSQGCTPVFKQAPLYGVKYQGYSCDTIGDVVQSACFGVCASASVQLLSGREFQRCECCKSYRTETLSTLIQCPFQSTPIRYSYKVITACDCSECDANGQYYAAGSSGGSGQREFAMAGMAAGGGSEDGSSAEVEGFSGMMSNVDSFNQ